MLNLLNQFLSAKNKSTYIDLRVKQWKLLHSLFKTNSKKINLIAFLVATSGILIFLFDLLFALSLQRFLASVGLVSGLTNTRFFGDLNSTSREGFILIVVTLLRIIFVGFNSFLLGLALAVVERDIKASLVDKNLNRLANGISRSSFIFTDVVLGASNFFSTFLSLFSRVIICTSLIFGLAMYSWQLTLGLMTLVIITSPIQSSLSRFISKKSADIFYVLESSNRKYITSIKNIVFISILGIRDEVKSSLNVDLAKIKSSRQKYFFVSSIRALLPQIIGISALVVIAGSPLAESFDNKSEIVPFLYLLLRFFQSLADIARTTSHLRLDFPRLIQLNNWHNDISQDQTPFLESDRENQDFVPGFYWKDLEFNWNRFANNNKYSDYRIEPGSIVKIDGETGTGKTTLLLLLTGIVSPTSGFVRIVKKSANSKTSSMEFNPSNVTVPTAYVGSEPFFVDGTIYENLLYGQTRTINKKEVIEMLKRVNLIQDKDDVKLLDKIINEAGLGLSSGQKQKLAWARALLMKPRLLILDESVSNLDVESKELLSKLLLKEKMERTTIIVDHSNFAANLVNVRFKVKKWKLRAN